MKCSNPNCNRGIGLIAYRRGRFSNCSRNCRDGFVADLPNRSRQEQNVSTYFGRLFLEPLPQKLTPAVNRIKAR